MKYTFLIHQRSTIEQGHDLDPYELIILDFLVHFTGSPNAEMKICKDILYVWASKSFILQQIPLLRCWDAATGCMKPWKEDTLHRRLKSLRDRGYISAFHDGDKYWIAVLNRTMMLYGDLMKVEFGLNGKQTIVKVDGNISNDTSLDGCISSETLDIFPTYKNITITKEKDSACTHVHARTHEEALNESPKTVESPTPTPKEVPAPPTSCPPPPNVKIDSQAGTVTGWGVTLTRQEIGAIGRIPAQPDFHWWFNLYGKNQQQMKAETQWMLKQGNWPQIAWHTVLYVTCTDPEFRKRPDAYLRDNVFCDDIDDRRPKPKPIDVKAEQDAPIKAPQKLNFGGEG